MVEKCTSAGESTAGESSCSSAGESTGQRAIGELLLQKGHRQKSLAGQPLTPPKKLSEVASLRIVVNKQGGEVGKMLLK